MRTKTTHELNSYSNFAREAYNDNAFCMFPRILEVATFELRQIDFAVHDIIITEALDSCVAAITCRNDLSGGSLAHLTVGAHIGDYLNWLDTHAPAKDPVFLVGGRSVYHGPDRSANSYRLISQLEEGLHARGRPCHKLDVLGRPTRKVMLSKLGLIVVQRRMGEDERYQLHLTMNIHDDNPELHSTPSSIATKGQILSADTVRVERLLPGSIDDIWYYLTVQKGLQSWFAVGDIPAKCGDSFLLHQRHNDLPYRSDGIVQGEVLRVERPYLLSYSWHNHAERMTSIVTFSLEPVGIHTRLTIKHSNLLSGNLAKIMAGWHAHTSILEARLLQVKPQNFMILFNEALAAFQTMLIPAA